MTRKLLEAYCTFRYSKGIDYLFQSDEILNESENSLFRYFKSSTIKYFLDMESHKEDEINNFFDRSLDLLSLENKIKLAKDVLCLMYLVDKRHIMSKIKDDSKKKEFEDNIIEWMEELSH